MNVAAAAEFTGHLFHIDLAFGTQAQLKLIFTYLGVENTTSIPCTVRGMSTKPSVCSSARPFAVNLFRVTTMERALAVQIHLQRFDNLCHQFQSWPEDRFRKYFPRSIADSHHLPPDHPPPETYHYVVLE